MKKTRQSKNDTVTFTLTEVQMAMWMVASLEADTFVSDRAKALVYKAKDFASGRVDYIEVTR